MAGAAAELPDRMGRAVKREEDPKLDNYTQQPILDSFHRLMTSNTFFIKLVITMQKDGEAIIDEAKRVYEDFSLLYALRRVGKQLQLDGTYIGKIIVDETKRSWIETTDEQNRQLRKERAVENAEAKQETLREDEVRLADVKGLQNDVLEELEFSDGILDLIEYDAITGGFDAIIYADGGSYLIEGINQKM